MNDHRDRDPVDNEKNLLAPFMFKAEFLSEQIWDVRFPKAKADDGGYGEKIGEHYPGEGHRRDLARTVFRNK